MANELRFDGKVVIVTGAGNGLGRSHARLFGSRGAKVVVNDLGGGATGGGRGSEAADRVVAEIREGGGEAVANYDSVEDGDRIVQTALDTFGRVDIVVNNAGILRDTTFHKMTDEDWELIYRVHVRGSYKVTHAAWPHMREQGYGRVIMTASAAGIYGNFGQTNYAMAKLGLVGLANTLALEGERKGIRVNTIAPIAASRLTETVLPKEVLEPLQPELVSPLVAWLCHETCDENGGLFEVGGGYFGKLRWERSLGKSFRVGREVSPEDVQSSFAAITSFEETEHPSNIAESMGAVMANVQRGKSKGGNAFVDVDEALGYEFEPMTSRYDERDLALYALGVGAAKDPNDLRYVYELGGDFAALPTYGVIPALNCILEMGKQGKQAPGLKYGLDRVLHGEQYTELLRPLPKSAKLTHRARIKDIFDKGKGAVVVTEFRTYDEDGDLLVINEVGTFVRGAGGWGGDSGPSREANAPPDRAPDATVEERIPENQALLYRLSGDWNPLHADPGFAKAFGFDRPILHGLCTFGYAGRQVTERFAPDGDPRYFKSIKVRFAKPVLPGQTLITEMWKESDQRVAFQCKVKETGETVISHAAVELYDQIPKKQAKPTAQAAAPQSAATGPAEPISRDIFAGIGAYFAANPGLSNTVGKVFQFKLSDPASVWTLDVKSNPPTAGEGETTKPDCTIEMSDANFMAMVKGEKDAQKMYFGGELKIGGDLMASQKLSFLQKMEPSHVEKAMKARLGGGGGAVPAGAKGEAPAAAAAAPAADAAAPKVFEALEARLQKEPKLVDEVKAAVRFVVGDDAWLVDMRKAPGTVQRDAGQSAEADCVLTLADADLASLARGEVGAQALYQQGKMRADGDVTVAHRLGFLKNLI
jgi:(3R)-3-hydroxyacyl-CoA dehydrogenase / 3a,7a,12a-trihydroxy-5b-cholest-24-enoyl-CoA hydratase / enoyl-CoA hydratase 2